jgi:glycosyltransferase involved in cell wall biosynthesis
MDNLKLFIWNPSIDHLQYYLWLALRSLVQRPVTFVLGSPENKIRRAQDWKQVDLKELNPILIPPQKLLREGIGLLRENSDAIHVFWAFRGAEGYNYFPLILFALSRGIKVVVLDEAYTTSPVGYFRDENPLMANFKTWVRPRLRRFMGLAINWFPNKPCIMPLSIIAKKQFINAGFAPNTLFPFGYFVPKQQCCNSNISSSTLRLIFVGALIFRKGYDILVEAVRELCEQGFRITLDIYGSGDSQKINSSNISICYKGTLPFDQIQGAIAEHDILILPSRHDGWGVVINEALLQGVPVILSNRVGAKCLVEFTGAGLVFESENISDLAGKMKMLIENPLFLQELKENARKVGDQILPEMAAQYFLDTLSYYFCNTGFRPSAIWSKDLVEE